MIVPWREVVHCHQSPCLRAFLTRECESMKQPIVGYHVDEEGHFVARLACGHNQHVRHKPPWQIRPWVITESGRQAHLGTPLDCRKCEEAAPRDWS